MCRNPEILRVYSVVTDNKVSISHIPNLAADSFLSRFNHSYIFSKILEYPQPLLYGSSLSEFFVSLGPPRFIWKDKPLSINASGNEFGHVYGIVNPDDFESSVSPTIVGDWYINFGLAGIIGGMFFIGLLFRVIYEYLIRATNHSLSGVMIYSIAWIQIMHGMESWIAPAYAGLFKLLIMLVIIHFFLRKK